MANEDLPRDPHLSALHRANGGQRPRVPDEVRAAVLRAAHEAVRPTAANDDAARKDGAGTKPIGGYRAQSRFAVAAVLVLAMGMGWQLIRTTAPTPDTAVTGEETVTASMQLGAPAEAPAEASAAAPGVAQAMDRSMSREAIAPPPPPPPVEVPAPVSAPMVANVAAPAMAEMAAAPAAAPPAMAAEPPLAAKSAPAAGAMADAAPQAPQQARAESALPTVVPVLVPPPARRYKSPQAWWAEIEALRKTDAAAAARETAEFKRVYPRWPADPTPAVPTDNR